MNRNIINANVPSLNTNLGMVGSNRHNLKPSAISPADLSNKPMKKRQLGQPGNNAFLNKSGYVSNPKTAAIVKLRATMLKAAGREWDNVIGGAGVGGLGGALAGGLYGYLRPGESKEVDEEGNKVENSRLWSALRGAGIGGVAGAGVGGLGGAALNRWEGSRPPKVGPKVVPPKGNSGVLEPSVPVPPKPVVWDLYEGKPNIGVTGITRRPGAAKSPIFNYFNYDRDKPLGGDDETFTRWEAHNALKWFVYDAVMPGIKTLGQHKQNYEEAVKIYEDTFKNHRRILNNPKALQQLKETWSKP